MVSLKYWVRSAEKRYNKMMRDHKNEIKKRSEKRAPGHWARRNARASGKLLKGLEGSEFEPKVPISVDRRSIGRRKKKEEEERLRNI